MTLDPQRWMIRNTTRLSNKAKRFWTSITVKDGSIYRIDDKMYQVYKGKYHFIGEVCHMCEDFDTIKQSELLK